MSRPRSFETDFVLAAAADCFWLHGYEATSVRRLSVQTGLAGPSLYNAFGDKRGLFIASLEHYAETAMRVRIGRLEREHDGDPLGAIAAFFGGLVERSLADPEHRGCLIVNTALEMAPHDVELRPVLVGYLEEIRGFFLRALKLARATNRLAAHLDTEDTSRMLLGLVLGLRVLARSNPDRDMLEGMVRPALASLDPSPSNDQRT